ncbi:hypothetical protein [Roseibium aestuarii]|uniref:Uncharacterized protein n=1 Tax=Roseibium aestuarii TaxID=2600299 RepID=A0ABW4JUM5_9HYPH|nr:hypothetical protein [Roseibium aestuarii]
MISAIVDGVLLLALLATTLRMLTMHRELKRLGSYHADYQRIFDQTALALDGIEVSIEEFNVKGTQVLNALGSRMNDARDLIAEIDGLTREAKRQQSVLKAELKELSRLTAREASPASFDTPQAAREAEAAQGDGKRRNRFLKTETIAETGVPETETSAAAPAPKAPRVHRIEEGAASPFRSISLSQKDDL